MRKNFGIKSWFYPLPVLIISTYIERAKANGVTATEMSEALTQLAFYAGWPKAWAALRMAKDVYGEE